ncbi:phage terminase large subunit, partial [bacterium]|nr:phage terminase large subunit [bacterium]
MSNQNDVDEGPIVDVNIPAIFEPLSQPARYKGIHGGRGSAKSRSAAQQVILDSLDHYERVFCARELQSSIKDSVKHVLDSTIERMGVSDLFHSTKTEIINKENGSNFIFYGLRHNPYKIKSLEGVTKVLVEESESVSQESLDILIPTIREEGSELWFIFNSKFKTDPVYKMFIENPREDAIIIN